MKILGLLLALSLCGNGWLAVELLRARARVPTAAREEAPRDEAEARPAPSSAWSALRDSPAPRRATATQDREGAPHADAAALAQLATVGPDEQREARCAVAEREQAERWVHDRDKTISGLRASLADASKQADDAAHVAKQLGDLLGLDDRREAELAERYAARRLPKMAAVRAALSSDPPDWPAVRAAARGLFGDEDALAAEYGGGDPGRLAARADALDGRSTIMALIAALAGEACDDAGCSW